MQLGLLVSGLRNQIRFLLLLSGFYAISPGMSERIALAGLASFEPVSTLDAQITPSEQAIDITFVNLRQREPETHPRPITVSGTLTRETGAANGEYQAASKPADKQPAPQRENAKAEFPTAHKLPPLTQQQLRLRKKIRRVLADYYTHRSLNTRDHGPWELMHWALAYEVHSQVLQGSPRGKPITTVGWLCFNQPARRRRMMYLNDDGQIRVRVAPALQGHHGQLLSILAQSSVHSEYPIRIGDQSFTVADLIEMEKQTCYPRTELTFKLISLSHYLDSDAQWVNSQGMAWNIPRLIREELRQPIRGAACGGTHRLDGLTRAYQVRHKRHEPVDGAYLEAQKFVQNYQRQAYRLQNSDGSFSTEWFRGRGAEEDIDRRLKTTGHTLEWLLYAATEKELHHWRTTRAANYLANLLNENRNHTWDNGILGHGIHALLLYDRQVFSKYDPPKTGPLAGKLVENRQRQPGVKSRSKRTQQARKPARRGKSGKG